MPMSRRPSLQAARRFVALLLSHGGGQGTLAGILGLTLATSLAEGAGLLLLVPILDLIGIGGEAAPEPARLMAGLGLYLLLVTLAALLVAMRSVAASDQRRVFVDRLRGDLHRALLRTSWPRFQAQRASDVSQIIITEVERLGNCYTHTIELAVTLVTVPTLLVASFILSPALTGLTLAISGLGLLVLHRLSRSGFSIGTRLGIAHRAMHADLTDDLAGFRAIKSFGSETVRRRNLESRFADVRHLQHRQVRIQALEKAILTVTAALAAATAILVAITWLDQPLSAAMAVILAFARLAQKGMGSLRTWRLLESNLPAIVSYDTLLDQLQAGQEQASETVPDLPPMKQALSFQGVGLRTPDGRVALHGIDLDLPFGTLLAVIGPSGAGKSTLADLAAGLAHPTTGRLLLDGMELTPDLLPAWRRQLAVVPQDPFLFHDTVRANLLVAAPDADEPALWTALEEAVAADFVRALPQGLDTVVGERGSAVSGGERQRLAIARALLRRPRLLILDEATSALDAGSEMLVLQTLDRLRGQITILAVTHRDQTRRAAGLVLELEAGRVKTLSGPAIPPTA
ncbi:MAG: ABC transporter ATP-binding protein [Niveispirillum sp.]|uniref:ABC transporter ATP-binding protein n=1 Tax=Niveispirillum sp. TaxID=1917217 RepID=UPI003BA56644